MFSLRPLAKKLNIMHLESVRTRIKLHYVTNECNYPSQRLKKVTGNLAPNSQMTSNSSKRTIPNGLIELLEGFVLVVLRDKPEDLVQYACEYFSSAKRRKMSLQEHGASVDELGVDFFTATGWNGLV